MQLNMRLPMASKDQSHEWAMPTGWYVPGAPGPEGIPEPGPVEVSLNIDPDTFTLELLEKAWRENAQGPANP
jgi:hypothetical protein